MRGKPSRNEESIESRSGQPVGMIVGSRRRRRRSMAFGPSGVWCGRRDGTCLGLEIFNSAQYRLYCVQAGLPFHRFTSIKPRLVSVQPCGGSRKSCDWDTSLRLGSQAVLAARVGLGLHGVTALKGVHGEEARLFEWLAAEIRGRSRSVWAMAEAWKCSAGVGIEFDRTTVVRTTALADG